LGIFHWNPLEPMWQKNSNVGRFCLSMIWGNPQK
jgi:hypothetical protein